MARIDTPADPFTELAFELERFEWTAADRLEVSGRWYGVRGRRFVRPTLHLRVDGRRRRLIAVLDHKPWAADTEDVWTAAFAWRGTQQGVTDPRLEVSSDVVLDLPAPGSATPAPAAHPAPPPETRAAPPTGPPAGGAGPGGRERASGAQTPREAAGGGRARPRRNPSRAPSESPRPSPPRRGRKTSRCRPPRPRRLSRPRGPRRRAPPKPRR